MKGLAWGALALAALGLSTSCGSPIAPSSPTPSPLPFAVLQQRYLDAAQAYAAAEAPVVPAENRYCDTASPSADLAACAAALSGDRQATVTFDDAVRTLRVASGAQPALTHLLSDDGRLETLLQQASTAPSMSAVSALTPQIFLLLTATAGDADALRRAIGLPASSPTP